MNNYPDFWKTLIGPGPLGSFCAYVVIGLICAAILMLIGTNNRELSSSNTPVKFSWSFFFAANTRRIIGNILLIPVAIRLSYPVIPAGAMIGVSVGIGLGFDGLLQMLKNKFPLTFGNAGSAAKVAEKIAPTDLKIDPPKE